MRNSITRWSRQNHGPAADQKRKRSENCSNRTSCRPIEVWFRFRRFNLQFYRVSIWKAQICYDTVWISHFSVSWYFVDRWRGKQRYGTHSITSLLTVQDKKPPTRKVRSCAARVWRFTRSRSFCGGAQYLHNLGYFCQFCGGLHANFGFGLLFHYFIYPFYITRRYFLLSTNSHHNFCRGHKVLNLASIFDQSPSRRCGV